MGLEGTLSKDNNKKIRIRKRKNKEILIKWLIWHVISSGAGCQVPLGFTHQTGGRTETRGGEGPAGKNIKTVLADGEGKDTNRDMIRGAVSPCVTVCERQKNETKRGTQT